MNILLQVSSIIVSVLLVILILLQVRGGALGSFMGDTSGGFQRTRRGLEKSLFRITIYLSIAWMAISMFSVVLSGQPY